MFENIDVGILLFEDIMLEQELYQNYYNIFKILNNDVNKYLNDNYDKIEDLKSNINEKECVLYKLKSEDIL